jgi:hypothetical protein
LVAIAHHFPSQFKDRIYKMDKIAEKSQASPFILGCFILLILSILSKLFRGVLSIDNFVIGTASPSTARTTSTCTRARSTCLTVGGAGERM